MSSEAGDAIEDHGTAIGKDKGRVRCNYCRKDVRGFNRLKHHLGGVGHDVTACIEVPDAVKARMRDLLLEKKKERLLKEVGELYHPDLPLKRRLSTPLADSHDALPEFSHSLPNFCSEESTVEMESGESENGSSGSAGPSHPNSSETTENYITKNLPTEVGIANGSIPVLCKVEDEHLIVKEEVKDDSVRQAVMHIGRFIYEAGIDPNSINLPSFQKMIDAIASCGSGLRVPSHNELNGWILQEKLKEVRQRVEDVRSCWGKTGCSIVVDGWTDPRGRSLIRFLVDSPLGTVFIRSVDASDIISDVDSLVLLFSKAIEEVGVQNVVQVIAHEKSCYMDATAKKLEDKYRSFFWTLCADYCINLIFEKIGMLDHVKKVFSDAKTITRFIYSQSVPFQLMKRHIQGNFLVQTLKLKSIADFMSLGNMSRARESLIHVFRSPAWCNSTVALSANGKRIAELVNDPLFWAAVADVMKITDPLITLLHQIDGGHVAPMGFLYDAMDRAKEAIKGNLGGKEAAYLPIWAIIDEIWDNYLHCPLHSAGYYLNPNLFCSNDFFVDAEVTNGLLGCIVRMVEGQNTQAMIVPQLEAYTSASGLFANDLAIDQRTKIPPALWWISHGSGSPELQRFAVKILNQPCSGSSRYKLDKNISEKVHHKGRSCVEQRILYDMEFVHNNLRLWSAQFSWEQKHYNGREDSILFDDWTAEVNSSKKVNSSYKVYSGR
ncbi:hypothetical protein AXF42_Ash012131 [Apostasia shenzhenica]|uniref:Uncharacterized protein n=1 Tax=Apostasia shenzhenica TaxID=1088818 RepID=A0A2I0B434_9ASPA|nr:hypothetical protein AXF42_Ash012131 [Apostasia shenzhenica]